MLFFGSVVYYILIDIEYGSISVVRAQKIGSI